MPKHYDLLAHDRSHVYMNYRLEPSALYLNRIPTILRTIRKTFLRFFHLCISLLNTGIMAKIIHRAEHVGSFLRAPSVLKAREDRAAGSASDADLRKIEDESIKNIVQNEIGNGLLSITDGEQRRVYFHLDFVSSPRIGSVG